MGEILQEPNQLPIFPVGQHFASLGHQVGQQAPLQLGAGAITLLAQRTVRQSSACVTHGILGCLHSTADSTFPVPAWFPRFAETLALREYSVVWKAVGLF